jgi:hypothetical protein
MIIIAAAFLILLVVLLVRRTGRRIRRAAGVRTQARAGAAAATGDARPAEVSAPDVSLAPPAPEQTHAAQQGPRMWGDTSGDERKAGGGTGGP